MSEITIRIGGVPEHFNLPIHLAIESGTFKERGINIQWTDYPGGSGHMTGALREGEVDLCVLLTEGIVADIIRGNQSQIISEYVVTPLTWGIHTGMNNSLIYDKQIFDKQHAVSRLGSGSHLMAMVNANTRGHALSPDQFTVVNDLDGALHSLNQLETDVFYWEKFTTKPYVDARKVQRIGEYVSPWPCFVIAATNAILEKHPLQIAALLDVINESCKNFMADSSVIPMIAKRYQQKILDTERWYHSTEWASDSWVSDKMLKSVIYHLKAAGIVSAEQTIPEFIWKRQTLITLPSGQADGETLDL
jgi:sulfonate transport system substrate-binding protein